MGWHSVTHNTSGLILADGVTLIALVVTLVKQRARATLLVASAVIALPCVLLGGIAAGRWATSSPRTEPVSPGPSVSFHL